jgi:hypothetical protein
LPFVFVFAATVIRPTHPTHSKSPKK